MVIYLNRRRLFLFTLILIAFIMVLIFMKANKRIMASSIVMGGQLIEQQHNRLEGIEVNASLTKISPDEKYFRPSKLPILNVNSLDSEFIFNFHPKMQDEINVPHQLLKTPEDTILNYFTILKQGENLTEDKSGGCGSVGDSNLPYRFLYHFFDSTYRKSISYDQFLKSFEGIGHTNLLKLHKVQNDINRSNFLKYFIEIETIEGSDKGVTFFAYYYGYVYLSFESSTYKIADIAFYGQDFLCAAYHGWSHSAEFSVDIKYGNWCGLVKERYETEQDGYIKNIYFKGTDNNDYLIVFFELTNGTDIEVEQYKKNSRGKWEPVMLDPNKCLENNT